MKKTIKYAIVFCAASLAFVNALASNMVVVHGKGVGTDRTEALKDAYRDAIETAVGIFVDAEQRMQNYELVKDEILTQSNAYIDDYDILDEKADKGVVKITIKAHVHKQALVKRIYGKKEAKTFTVGDSLKGEHAKDATMGKRDADGATLLKKELKGLNVFAQLCDVSLVSPKPVILETRTEIAEVAYLLKIEIDRDRYFKEFLPSLRRTLKQISTDEPKPFIAAPRGFGDEEEDFKKYVDLANANASGRDLYLGNGFNDVFELESQAFRKRLSKSYGHSNSRSLQAAIVSSANKPLTLIKGELYSLDEASSKALDDWREEQEKTGSSRPMFTVTFLDANGEELSVGTVTFSSNESSNNYRALSPESKMRTIGREGHTYWLVTPWIGTNCTAFYQWFKFRVAKDDLPKVKSIKVEYCE